MRGVPLACWCRQQRCLALSFGLLLVSSSSFVLSLTPPFSVLSFIYFRHTDFLLSSHRICWGWDWNCKSGLLGFLFARRRSSNCFPVSLFYLYLVSLLLACQNILACRNLRNRNCKSAPFVVFFLFVSRSANCFPVSVFYLFLVSL